MNVWYGYFSQWDINHYPIDKLSSAEVSSATFFRVLRVKVGGNIVRISNSLDPSWVAVTVLLYMHGFRPDQRYILAICRLRFMKRVQFYFMLRYTYLASVFGGYSVILSGSWSNSLMLRIICIFFLSRVGVNIFTSDQSTKFKTECTIRFRK